MNNKGEQKERQKRSSRTKGVKKEEKKWRRVGTAHLLINLSGCSSVLVQTLLEECCCK